MGESSALTLALCLKSPLFLESLEIRGFLSTHLHSELRGRCPVHSWHGVHHWGWMLLVDGDLASSYLHLPPTSKRLLFSDPSRHWTNLFAYCRGLCAVSSCVGDQSAGR